MSKIAKSVLQLDGRDNVGVALAAMAANAEIGRNDIAARQPIPAGHKIALRAIAENEPILKYGQAIGLASEAITAGSHVHTHNIIAEAASTHSTSRLLSPIKPKRRAEFRGFRRASGRVGTRNYIGIVCSVNCSATVAKAIAASFDNDPRFAGEEGVDGVVAFTHTSGCGMSATGEGPDILRRTLAGYVDHPNFGGVLVAGLGCEVMQPDLFLADSTADADRVTKRLTIQNEGGTRAAIAEGRRLVEELIDQLSSARREEVSAEHLVLGLQCGGSDAWSGITANPALGVAADILVSTGGTVILSETPEIYGAEQLLLDRAENDQVRKDLLDRLAWWQDYAARNGAALNNNPSPGNIAGGLSTILEKSLGAVVKSGHSPLRRVYRYAQPIDEKGFVFMDSPGYDPCSATGQTAAGANILAFTTGRGSVFGSKPAPCIKLASNAEMARRMEEDMDIDCSPVLETGNIEEMGERIFELLLDVASGRRSKSEELGLGDLEFVPWQMGAVL